MFTPTKPKNYFLSQVHQPFFLFGVIYAVVVMLLFMLSYKGILTLRVDTLSFHSYSLIYVVFTQFFTGFIFTTFPRFTQGEVIGQKSYMRVFIIHQAGSLLFVLGSVYSIYMLYGGLFFLFFANSMIVNILQKIYMQSHTSLRSDPRWILVGFYFGVFGHFLFILSFLQLGVNAAPFALNLYLVFVTFSVAQRMVPFFSHSFAPKNENFAPIVFIGLLLKVVANYLSLVYVESIIDIALGLYIGYEIKRWKLGFKNGAAILKILHLSLYWLLVSLILGAVFHLLEGVFGLNFMQMQVHLLALGFVTTMLIGFGTRVTLGHSGQPPHADGITLKIFYILQAVVIGRIIFSIAMGAQTQMFWLFDLSSALWLVLFVFWALRFGPVLTRAKKL
ncbi:NnrS family protein [bacterium]|nr:NnrS family protein [bacterium]